MHTLLRFLRADPYGYHFCYHCDCKTFFQFIVNMPSLKNNIKSSSLLKSETMYDYASDLRNYTLICLPSLSEEDRSKVAVIHSWRGLHQTEEAIELTAAVGGQVAKLE
jgi:hypothetical protein